MFYKMADKINKLENEIGQKVLSAIKNRLPRGEVMELFKTYCKQKEQKNSLYGAIYNQVTEYFI